MVIWSLYSWGVYLVSFFCKWTHVFPGLSSEDHLSGRCFRFETQDVGLELVYASIKVFYVKN